MNRVNSAGCLSGLAFKNLQNTCHVGKTFFLELHPVNGTFSKGARFQVPAVHFSRCITCSLACHDLCNICL